MITLFAVLCEEEIVSALKNQLQQNQQNLGDTCLVAASQWSEPALQEEATQLLAQLRPHSILRPINRATRAQTLRRLVQLFRPLARALNQCRSQLPGSYLFQTLNQLVLALHTLLYASPSMRFRDVVYFLQVQFPHCFRKHWRAFGVSLLIFTLGCLVGYLTPVLDPDTLTLFMPAPVIENVRHGKLWMMQIQAAPSESTFLMANNIRVAVNAFAFGVLFGIGTLVILFQNGMFAVGGPLGVCTHLGMGRELILFMLPHGVIELLTIIISGGAGMIMGLALLFPGDRSRWMTVQEQGKDALVLILGCIPLLIIAGLIEGLVSLNQTVPEFVRILVALVSAVVLTLYLGFSGRSKRV